MADILTEEQLSKMIDNMKETPLFAVDELPDIEDIKNSGEIAYYFLDEKQPSIDYKRLMADYVNGKIKGYEFLKKEKELKDNGDAYYHRGWIYMELIGEWVSFQDVLNGRYGGRIWEEVDE